MSVTTTTVWNCDGCLATLKDDRYSSFPPNGWTLVMNVNREPASQIIKPKDKHYCPDCAKEKGL